MFLESLITTTLTPTAILHVSVSNKPSLSNVPNFSQQTLVCYILVPFTFSCHVPSQNPAVFYTTMVGFSSAIWVVALLMFSIVARVISQSENKARGYELDPRTTSLQVRGTFSVVVLTGVAWLFGIFVLREGYIALEILFVIANVLQALLLFIFRCVIYYEAKAAWMQLFREGTFRRGSSSSSFESPLARGRDERTSREVFATNPIITNTNVWHKADQVPRTRSRNRVVSLKYGRQNVNFADVLEQEYKPQTQDQSRRNNDGFGEDPHITEL